VGYQFDQVAVAPGHARNFLIPQRIAVYAHPQRIHREVVLKILCRYATPANKQLQQERLQGEAAAAIEKRRVADAVLKVPSRCQPHGHCGLIRSFSPPLQRLSSVSLLFERAASAGMR
jgi:ribosomal protein L9